jgi:hypothetical protein
MGGILYAYRTTGEKERAAKTPCSYGPLPVHLLSGFKNLGHFALFGIAKPNPTNEHHPTG